MNQEENKTNEFTITIKNGALVKLKELAKQLDISEDKLGDVLVKGMKIIELAKDGKLIVEKGNERLEINLKEI